MILNRLLRVLKPYQAVLLSQLTKLLRLSLNT